MVRPLLVTSNTYRPDHGSTNQITKTKFPTDWTLMQKISFWVYNEAVNNETITIVFNSENSTSTGIDYFTTSFKLNFVGWNLFSFNKTQFGRVRSPIGWNSITGITFSCSWTLSCVPGTNIYLDEMQVFDSNGNVIPDIKNPGLSVVSQDTKSKQFIVADAPNNPATSYHPVAISKITTNGSFYWNHVLVAGDTTKSASFVASHGDSYSNYTITAGSASYMLDLYRSASALTGMSLYDASSNRYTVYSANLRHNSIVIEQQSTFQLVPVLANTTRCEFSLVAGSSLTVTCEFASLVDKNVDVTINGVMAGNVVKNVTAGTASLTIAASSASQNIVMQVVSGTTTTTSSTGSTTAGTTTTTSTTAETTTSGTGTTTAGDTTSAGTTTGPSDEVVSGSSRMWISALYLVLLVIALM